MRARSALVAPAAAAALLGGLGAAIAGDAAPRAPTYYQDVKPILDARCAGCHTVGGVAPFPLRTYTQARRRAAAVAAAVRNRVMPPWHAEAGYRRYLNNPSLTADQISVITRWVARGAPEGDSRRPGSPLPRVGGGLSRPDLRLALPTYTPRRTAAQDDYRCFVVRWPEQRPRFVTGFDVAPGERREVHHIIVYAVSDLYAATVDAWDARERLPGYGCYGGPSATGERTLPVQLLAGWAPGASGTDFPSGTGTLVRPGSRLVVQVHYNVHTTVPRPDRSVIALKLDDSVQRQGAVAPVVDLGWLVAPRSFRVPAGRKRVVHSFTGDPRPALRLLGSELDLSHGFLIHSVALHMHKLGKRAQLALVRASGKREVLLSIRRWDFDWQRDYRLAEPVRFANGDRLSIRCEHTNPYRRTITWGEDSADEMCVGFVYVSEP